MTIVLDKARPSPSQVDCRVLVPLRREQIDFLLAFYHPDELTDAARDDIALLDYARRNPELP